MTTADVVDKILAGGDIRESIMESLPVTEGFAIGSYLKFKHGIEGFFTKDQKNDVYLVFEMPIDGLVSKLNLTTTFKLIGYNGDTAKIVAMVNDKMNGNKFGEVYFVAKEALMKNAKRVLPRMNKWMNGRYNT